MSHDNEGVSLKSVISWISSAIVGFAIFNLIVGALIFFNNPQNTAKTIKAIKVISLKAKLGYEIRYNQLVNNSVLDDQNDSTTVSAVNAPKQKIKSECKSNNL